MGETGESPRVSFSCKITASRAAKSNHTTHTANSSSASDTTASKCFTLWTRSNCCAAALLSVQIKPSHDSPDHLCLHPKQKHCKPSPTVIFLLLENIHSRVSFLDSSIEVQDLYICVSENMLKQLYISMFQNKMIQNEVSLGGSPTISATVLIIINFIMCQEGKE